MNIFFTVLGLALLGWGIAWAIAFVVKLATWSRTTGIVVGLDKGLEMGDEHPRVRFMSPTGDAIEFVSPYCVRFRSFWTSGRVHRRLWSHVSVHGVHWPALTRLQ